MLHQRIGAVVAVVAVTTLSGCAMWNNMTDRITGRSTSTTTASRGDMSTSGMTTPGSSLTNRGTPTIGSGAVPRFGSYNECRAWLQNQLDARAPQTRPFSGEVSMADQDPCERMAPPRRS